MQWLLRAGSVLTWDGREVISRSSRGSIACPFPPLSYLNTRLLAAPLILVLDTRSLVGDNISIAIHLYVLFTA